MDLVGIENGNWIRSIGEKYSSSIRFYSDE